MLSTALSPVRLIVAVGAAGDSRSSRPPAVILPLGPAICVILLPSVCSATTAVPALIGWFTATLPDVVAWISTSPLLVVIPDRPPTVPIIRSVPSLRNAKPLPTPVTLAASVPTWLASSIETGPTEVMPSVAAITDGVCVMAPSETRVTLLPGALMSSCGPPSE